MIEGRYYRRDLPHIHKDFEPMFITFCTCERWALPDVARRVVLDCCVHEHEKRVHLFAAVVMPDHVHLAIKRMFDNEEQRVVPLPEITQAIKSVSAHRINQLLGRKGAVWQDESFDHIFRSSGSLQEKVVYILDNPVRKGLASSRADYPFLWVADESYLKI